MSIDLLAEFEAAQAHVDQLRRQIAAAPCKSVGHDWQSIGGANAGCGRDCSCSVPVNECARCGDCDYGDNDDAAEVRKECSAIAEVKDEHC